MRLLTSHKAFLFLVVVNAVAFALLNAVTFPRQSLASPTVGAPVASPAMISVGQPSEVTVTSRITTGPGDPPVIATSVYLQRLDASNKVITTLGTMRDDGSAGDGLAGDGVFTLRVTLNEPGAGEVLMRVSAAFRRLLRRLYSPPLLVPILARSELSSGGITVSFGHRSELEVSIDGASAFVYDPSGVDPENELVLPPDITMEVVPNPSALSLDDVLRGYRSGWYNQYHSITSFTANGRAALLADDRGAQVEPVPPWLRLSSLPIPSW